MPRKVGRILQLSGQAGPTARQHRQDVGSQPATTEYRHPPPAPPPRPVALPLPPGEPPHRLASRHRHLRRLVNPGGRVLFGEGFWEHPPAPGEIAAMWPGITIGDHYDLAGLTGQAVSAGFRPEWIETASLEEWDDFESGAGADVEEWLAGHPDHPQAPQIRKKADDRLSIWLRGSRGCMGLAYLTLIPLP